MKVRGLCLLAAACLIAVVSAFAEDAAKVDPKHYKVISENAEVRILKVHYGPHEKSVMHSHPDAVIVYLTDAKTRFTGPDGATTEADGKAGEARFTPATVHLPENVGDKPFDGILIELKGKKTPPKAGEHAKKH